MITIKMRFDKAKRNSFRSFSDRIMKDNLQKTLIPKFQDLLGHLKCDESTHETFYNEIFISENGNTIELGRLCCGGFRTKVLTNLSSVAEVSFRQWEISDSAMGPGSPY